MGLTGVIAACLLIIYSIGGALVFQYLEGGQEASVKTTVVQARGEFLDILWSLRAVNSSVWTRTMKGQLSRLETDLYTAFQNGVTSTSDLRAWDFWGSLIYCGTVYTTVGYGHIAPATPVGRLATIVYAVLGIPLCLIFLTDLGKVLTRALKLQWAFVNRFCHTRSQSPRAGKNIVCGRDGAITKYYGHNIDDRFNLPVSVATVICIVYVLLGVLLYSRWEEWTVLESVYFLFVTLSTIGFGDVIPSQPVYFVWTALYVAIGMSLVSMTFNVIMETMQQYVWKAEDKLKLNANCSEPFDKKTS